MIPASNRRGTLAGGVVALALVAPSAWCDSGQRYAELNAGVESGEFITDVDATLYHAELRFGAVWERYDVGISLPYLHLDEDTGNETGLGDVTVHGGIELLAPGREDSLYGTLAVKLPTADEDEGLGTGETDLGGFVTYRRPMAHRDVDLLLMGGYIVTGDPPNRDSDNIFTYGIGVSSLWREAFGYATLEGRQSVADADAPLELHLGGGRRVDGSHFVTADGYVGLAGDGPDFGITLGVIRWF